MNRRPVVLAIAVAALTGGAGLGLAQDQTANGITNTVAPAETPAVLPPTVAPLVLPPAEEAPAASPSPKSAPSDNVAGDAEAANTLPPAPPPPPTRPRYTTAVLQALDKVTAETLRFEARINEPVRYKDLVITVHACETQASDEPYAQTAAHLEVQYQPDVLPIHGAPIARQVFRGWMFGEAPGLHPFEHPIYDVWLIACKTPSAAAAPSPPGASL